MAVHPRGPSLPILEVEERKDPEFMDIGSVFTGARTRLSHKSLKGSSHSCRPSRTADGHVFLWMKSSAGCMPPNSFLHPLPIQCPTVLC